MELSGDPERRGSAAAEKNRRGFSSIGENRAGIKIWLGTYKPSGCLRDHN